MHKVSIKPQWSIRDEHGESLSPRLLELLAQVHDHGSLSGACRHSGASYRHAWNLVRQGEQQIGSPLLRMARGKGSSLTPLGEKLVWAGHRIAARLTPLLETLASELEVEIGHVLAADRDLLRVHASHGFAIEKLFERLAEHQVDVERRYVGSQEAVASLHDGACDLAGFHVPEGEFEARAYAHYARWFDARDSRVIHVATRHQGLMLAAGNPLKIYGVADLARAGVRFVNRQRGSGTRFLLDCLLAQAGIDVARIAGYEQGEYTHAAVAAYVASGMADVGFGVETPARRFKLEFLPVATERYFLICREATLQRPAMRAALDILRSDVYQRAVDELPGYTATRCGQVDTLPQVWAAPASAQPAAARRAVPRRASKARIE
jgi:molybdate transport repressor ModE-like protein